MVPFLGFREEGGGGVLIVLGLVPAAILKGGNTLNNRVLFTDDSWLKIQENRTWDVFPLAGLREERREAIVGSGFRSVRLLLDSAVLRVGVFTWCACVGAWGRAGWTGLCPIHWAPPPLRRRGVP